MNAVNTDLVRFHLLRQPLSVGTKGLLPAALMPYRDLTGLRHDYPLVLSSQPPYVHSLADLMNDVMQRLAPRGASGERLRRHLLAVEKAMRTRLSLDPQPTPFSELWDIASADLQPESASTGAEVLRESLEQARRGIDVTGDVVGCDADVPSNVVKHVWQALQDQKNSHMGRRIVELIFRLAGILKADLLQSEQGRRPAELSASLGGQHTNVFDFGALSRILTEAQTGQRISEARRLRIQSALTVLLAQRFFPTQSNAEDDDAYPFLLTSCRAASQAIEERSQALTDLVKAMAIAELELENRYREEDHDSYFEEFDVSDLTVEELQLFPSYLICLEDDALAAEEKDALFDLLASHLPIKILLQVRDVLGDPSSASALGRGVVFGQRLGSIAMGLGNAYVLQSSSSLICKVAERIRAGLTFKGPSLFSIYAGPKVPDHGLHHFLNAAAAVESRAFPAFSYDPDAGFDLVERFNIDFNPQAETAWPLERITYESSGLQREEEASAFTLIEFAAMDSRYGSHYELTPPDSWSDQMVPVDRYFEGGLRNIGKEAVPYIMMGDDDGTLHRVIVSRELIQVAQRFHQGWHGLQELGGVNNSHARALLDIERARWEEQTARAVEALETTRAPTLESVVSTTEDDLADTEEEAEPPQADEPYIETTRCTTCDECTDLNDRMFAYDENKQAYISDLSAGTYREMVEAAEACQVAIIHPGKPWDPTESGIDDLVVRAAAFN